jgi:hypothetical protein
MVQTILEDTSLVAFLALRGRKFKPFQRPDGRVSFELEGDISSDLQELYTNPPIPILDYLKWFKTVRNAVFSLKGGNKL